MKELTINLKAKKDKWDTEDVKLKVKKNKKWLKLLIVFFSKLESIKTKIKDYFHLSKSPTFPFIFLTYL